MYYSAVSGLKVFHDFMKHLKVFQDLQDPLTSEKMARPPLGKASAKGERRSTQDIDRFSLMVSKSAKIGDYTIRQNELQSDAHRQMAWGNLCPQRPAPFIGTGGTGCTAIGFPAKILAFSVAKNRKPESSFSKSSGL